MALLSSSDLGVCSYHDSSVFSPSSSSGSVTVFTKFSTRKKSNHRRQQSANAAECAGITDDISWFPSDCDHQNVQ